MSPLEEMVAQTKTFGSSEMVVQKHGDFLLPNAQVLLIEAVQGKIRFIYEPNVSHIDFGSMLLLQHSDRDRRIACNNSFSPKPLPHLNPLLIQEEYVAHDTKRGHLSYSSLCCITY